ncbi:MAG: hypothetical protein ACRCU2_01380, partial [Planktothrix sp.]
YAIQAAAQVIADNCETLKDILQEKIWDIIWAIYQQRNHDILKFFWERLKPVIQQKALIWTSQQEWVKPYRVCLLEIKEEYEVTLPILELAIQKIERSSIVHSNLQDYSTLLREVGVLPLDSCLLADGIQAWGLDKPTVLNQVPEWIRKKENRDCLGKEIKILLNRDTTTTGKDRLANCAIALTYDGESLSPPKELFKATEQGTSIVGSFADYRKFIACDEWEDIKELANTLQIPEAIKIMEQNKEKFKNRWEKDSSILTDLFEWLEDRKNSFKSDKNSCETLKKCHIFPSGGELRPLVGLAIAGSFKDPLNLASLIELEAIGGHKEFLQDVLGVKELDFREYALNHIPQAFITKPQLIPAEARRQLVLLLANNLTNNYSDSKIKKDVLGNLPIVECKTAETNPDFFAANQTYLDTPAVVNLWGNWKPIAILPEDRREDIKLLLIGLGIAEKPRPADLRERIKSILKKYPSPEGQGRQEMQKIFNHLRKRWTEEGKTLGSDLQELKTLRWLPADGDETTWYPPSGVYSQTNRHLFETQVRFLDFPPAKTTEFANFLGIRQDPTVQQVVDHLLKCAKEKIEVSPLVYDFLQKRIHDPILDSLTNQECIHNGNGQYLRPDRVFWSEHNFGSYRHQLGKEFDPYRILFDRLGVQAKPQPKDAISVLEEIKKQYQNDES